MGPLQSTARAKILALGGATVIRIVQYVMIGLFLLTSSCQPVAPVLAVQVETPVAEQAEAPVDVQTLTQKSIDDAAEAMAVFDLYPPDVELYKRAIQKLYGCLEKFDDCHHDEMSPGQLTAVRLITMGYLMAQAETHAISELALEPKNFRLVVWAYGVCRDESETGGANHDS